MCSKERRDGYCKEWKKWTNPKANNLEVEDLHELSQAKCDDKERPLSLPFIDKMLDRLAGKQFYYFLDGYSGYN